MRRAIGRAIAPTLLILLAGCAAGGGGDDGPAVGQAARARHGADPVAVPPADVGNAEDPAAPHS